MGTCLNDQKYDQKYKGQRRNAGVVARVTSSAPFVVLIDINYDQAFHYQLIRLVW